jgi:hypothetical protein
MRGRGEDLPTRAEIISIDLGGCKISIKRKTRIPIHHNSFPIQAATPHSVAGPVGTGG